MANRQSLLFLYMVQETGHQKAAEAIIEAASHMDPRAQSYAVDAVSHSYPLLGKVVNKVYLQMLKTAPAIWDYLYDNPDVEEATRDARGIITALSSFRVRKMLRRFRPTAVVCTQATPAAAIASEKKKGRLHCPFIGVVTDYGVHSYWYHPEVDLYLVGHDDVKKEMMRKGVPESRIRVTGIPIRPKFGETVDVHLERRRLRLHPSKMTLLVMGGSHGLGPLDELVEALKKVPSDFQTIVVCGRNRAVYKKIMAATENAPNFHVMGYVKDLATLMGVSDILISKPGGLTCSEALAKQLPMIVTAPLPGQEERNVRFLLKYQVARLARTSEDLVHALTDLLRHPQKIASMRQRAKIISRPHSAWEAARLIFDLVNRRGRFARAGAVN